MHERLAPLPSSLELFEVLRSNGETLADELRERILALGADAALPLIALLEDEELAREDAPGDGWPPIHAVDLLVDLRAEAAIGPMLAALRRGELEEVLTNRIVVRVSELGASVLEPALAELSSPRDRDHENALSEVLSQLGVADERIWRAIVRSFENKPGLGAGFLANYGDPRALPLLEGNIYAIELPQQNTMWSFDLRELVDAYEQIGGELPEGLANHVSDLLAHEEALARLSAATPAVSTKVGRNEACPCGSGKKYKRCCLV
ncbi:MAG: SEC-C metal-binding domain-containing protein [Polyangiaceae bacterium]